MLSDLSYPVILGVVTHFKIWTAIRICEVMAQSPQIWESNGSATDVPRFVEPPRGPVELPDCPFAKRVAVSRS